MNCTVTFKDVRNIGGGGAISLFQEVQIRLFHVGICKFKLLASVLFFYQQKCVQYCFLPTVNACGENRTPLQMRSETVGDPWR